MSKYRYEYMLKGGRMISLPFFVWMYLSKDRKRLVVK